MKSPEIKEIRLYIFDSIKYFFYAPHENYFTFCCSDANYTERMIEIFYVIINLPYRFNSPKNFLSNYAGAG